MRKREIWLGYWLVLPAVLIIAGLVLYPVGHAAVLSFTRKVLGQPARFVGLRNYAVIVQDPVFWQTTVNTLLFTFVSLAFKAAIGVGLALLLNLPFRGRRAARALMVLPWAVPILVTALVWRWLLDDSNGLINNLLLHLGVLSRPIPWLASIDWALPAVIAVNIWRGVPFFTVNILAGLQGIDRSLYEAAAVDGASWRQQLRHVTLPGIRLVLLVTALLSTIWTFNEFQQVWVMTAGGPAHSTEVVSTLAYYMGIRSMRLDQGAAVSLIFLPALVALILVSIRYLERKQA